jgi:lipopolysaccharide/colanic/teichoic acid biosynthesis glycosyltransferase
VRSIGTVLGAVFVLGILPLILQDAYNWCWPLAKKVMHRAAKCLPEHLRNDREREWNADLYQLRDRGLSALIWATGTLIHAPNLARIEQGLPSIQYSAAKRTFDLLVASAALVLIAPLFAAVALIIRLTSDGPVLVRQVRTGRDGRTFLCLKFRTMRIDSDLKARGFSGSEPFFKLAVDPRMTSIGRLIRRFYVDELPQLWNVVRGDMSMVGPRPFPPDQAESLPAEERRELLKAAPGVVSGTDLKDPFPRDWETFFRQHLAYVERRTFWLDVRALIAAIFRVLRGS